MSYEQTFEEQIRQMQDERQRRERWECKRKQLNGEYIYAFFCVWCNAYADSASKTDPATFAKWLKDQQIELTSYQRKFLATNYFGYTYTFDYNKMEYDISKAEKVLTT